MKKTTNKRNLMKKISLSEMLTGIVVAIVLALTLMFFFTFRKYLPKYNGRKCCYKQ